MSQGFKQWGSSGHINPQSTDDGRSLVKQLLDDFIHNPSPYFHINGDEPYDLVAVAVKSSQTTSLESCILTL
jgi:hypothetical protein